MALNIAVLVKQVPDMGAVKIDRATGRASFGGKDVVSSYDEHAIEEAIRLKEAHGGEVVVLCAGGPGAKDAINRALAMGADRGVHLDLANPNDLDTLALAEILTAQVRALEPAPDLVIAGQNSDDYATGQVGPQVAELLEWPHLSSVTKVEVAGGTVTVERDTEDGKQVCAAATPLVLLAMTGLNEPRLPSLKGIMAAKKKPVAAVTPALPPGEDRVNWSDPYVPTRTAAGVVVQDVPPAEAAQRLVAWLREQRLV